MRVTIHQPEHLPWLGFLGKISEADLWIALDSVPFRKNYFQNRNRILLEGVPTWVTVPVTAPHGIAIRDVTIADDARWRHKYIARVTQAYRNTPWSIRLDELAQMIGEAKTGDPLVDLNYRIIEWLAREFKVDTPVVRASDVLSTSATKTALLVELLAAVGATAYLSGPSGRDYLHVEQFANAGIDLEFYDLEHPDYEQGGAFQSHLSAVDALARLDDPPQVLLGTARISRT